MLQKKTHLINVSVVVIERMESVQLRESIYSWLLVDLDLYSSIEDHAFGLWFALKWLLIDTSFVTEQRHGN